MQCRNSSTQHPPTPKTCPPSNYTEIWLHPGTLRGLGNPAHCGVGGEGRVGGLHLPEYEAQKAGPLTSLCVRKTPARSLPIKHRALGDSADSRVSSCEFPDVPASACHPSVSDGWEGPMPGPTLPWGPPKLHWPVASHPHFRWPNTIWAQLKAQPPESWSEEGDTDRVKSGNKALSPAHWIFPGRKHISLAFHPEQAHHLLGACK